MKEGNTLCRCMVGFTIYSISVADGTYLDDGLVGVGGRAMRFECEGEKPGGRDE